MKKIIDFRAELPDNVIEKYTRLQTMYMYLSMEVFNTEKISINKYINYKDYDMLVECGSCLYDIFELAYNETLYNEFENRIRDYGNSINYNFALLVLVNAKLVEIVEDEYERVKLSEENLFGLTYEDFVYIHSMFNGDNNWEDIAFNIFDKYCNHMACDNSDNCMKCVKTNLNLTSSKAMKYLDRKANE